MTRYFISDNAFSRTSLQRDRFIVVIVHFQVFCSVSRLQPPILLLGITGVGSTPQFVELLYSVCWLSGSGMKVGVS